MPFRDPRHPCRCITTIRGQPTVHFSRTAKAYTTLISSMMCTSGCPGVCMGPWLPLDSRLEWLQLYRLSAAESQQPNQFSGFVQDEVSLFDKRLRVTIGSKFEHNDFTGFEVEPNIRFARHPQQEPIGLGCHLTRRQDSCVDGRGASAKRSRHSSRVWAMQY